MLHKHVNILVRKIFYVLGFDTLNAEAFPEGKGQVE